MHIKTVFRFSGITSLAFLFLISCGTEPVFNTTAEPIDLSGWENTGTVNASFLATGRSFASTSSSSSPTFTVDYIATASNIDSLVWQFEGGVPASSTLVQQSVEYTGFGAYDVGLKVFNTEDRDTRSFEDFIRLYYKDDWSFSTDSWTSSSTTDFEPKTDSDGDPIPSWIEIPYTVGNEALCVKDFSGFPSNKLVLEFEYKLEKVSNLYVASSSSESSTTTGSTSATTMISTYTLTTLDDPITYVDATATPTPTQFESPQIYPGLRRLSLLYNGIPIWIASSMTNGVFKRVKLSLPSLSDFQIGFRKSQSIADEYGVIEYPYHTEIRNITIKLEEE